jgi:23S rRNA pseudouridine2605 synthase
MLEAVGHPVRRLHRSVYAGLTLAGLAPGEWRELAPSEVQLLVRVVRGGDLGDRGGKESR